MTQRYQELRRAVVDAKAGDFLIIALDEESQATSIWVKIRDNRWQPHVDCDDDWPYKNGELIESFHMDTWSIT